VVESQTLFDMVDAVAKHARGAYEAIGARARAAPVAGADETRWPVHGKASESSPSKWHAWLLGTDDSVYFEIHDTRGRSAAESLLRDFEGVLITDEYSVYRAIASERPALRHAHCWAHVRREYIEIEKAFPVECAEVLFWMRWMWAVESVARRADGAVDAERLTDLRNRFSRAAVGQIEALAHRIVRAHEPGSRIHVVAKTMLEVWPALTLFLDDPRVPIDNNARERALRGMVVGRKNHYGSRSRRGTEVAAVLYTLIETAKLAAVEPRQYIAACVRRALRLQPPVTPQEFARLAPADEETAPA
jgi:transposase